MSIIYSLMSIFVALPFLGLIPVIIFLFVYRLWGSTTALIVAISWALYVVYESLIIFDFICAGDCNIRVDLLTIYPLLLGLSALAIITTLMRFLKRETGD